MSKKIINNPWLVNVGGGILVLIIGYYILGIGKERKLETEDSSLIKSDSSQIEKVEKQKFRPLEPLETGKKIGELPNDVYFYAFNTSIAYEIKDPGFDFIKASNKKYENSSFEIQKNNDRYYLIGFISSESHSHLGSLRSGKSLYAMLSPRSWGGATHPISIPFDAIYSIDDRSIELDTNTSLSVLDIGFKEAVGSPEIH